MHMHAVYFQKYLMLAYRLQCKQIDIIILTLRTVNNIQCINIINITLNANIQSCMAHD